MAGHEADAWARESWHRYHIDIVLQVGENLMNESRRQLFPLGGAAAALGRGIELHSTVV
jgi:hypothetical protein